jgi:uncharacterized protein YkwD
MVVNHPHPHFLACPRHSLGQLAIAIAIAALTLLSLSSVASARSGPCPFSNTRITQATRGEMDRAVVCLVNKQRTSRGLPRLRSNPRLNHSAQAWTNEMVRNRDFSHGADFSARISAVGFDWSNAGENIAGGYRTPAQAVHGWMGSLGHCQNILSPVYRYVGTGVSNGASLENFAGTWTQDFGLLMGQSAPSGNYGPAEGCPYR